MKLLDVNTGVEKRSRWGEYIQIKNATAIFQNQSIFKMSCAHKVWSENKNYTIGYDQANTLFISQISKIINNETFGMNWLKLCSHEKCTQLIQCGLLNSIRFQISQSQY